MPPKKPTCTNNALLTEIRQEQCVAAKQRDEFAKEQMQIAKDRLDDAGHISSLMNNVADLKKKFVGVETSLVRILGYLENDNTTNTKGFIEQTRNNAKDIHNLNEFKQEILNKNIIEETSNNTDFRKNLTAKFVGLSLASGFFSGIILFLLKTFIL